MYIHTKFDAVIIDFSLSISAFSSRISLTLGSWQDSQRMYTCKIDVRPTIRFDHIMHKTKHTSLTTGLLTIFLALLAYRSVLRVSPKLTSAGEMAAWKHTCTGGCVSCVHRCEHTVHKYMCIPWRRQYKYVHNNSQGRGDSCTFPSQNPAMLWYRQQNPILTCNHDGFRISSKAVL